MSTEVAKATENFFTKYGEAVTRRNIVGDLLLFTKFGEWVHGRDRARLATGTTLAAYMQTLEAGWACWQYGELIDEKMGLVCEGFVPPKRDELGDLDETKWETFDNGDPKDPWQPSNKLVLVDLESDALYTFSTSSKGGLSAIGELAKDYGKHIRQKPDEMPIVELNMYSYLHPNRAYGEIRNPTLKILDGAAGWIAAAKLPPIDGVTVSAPAVEDAPALPLPDPPPAIAPLKKTRTTRL
jgi:hypothetical protein